MEKVSNQIIMIYRLKEKGALEAAEVAYNAAEENVLYMDGYLQHNDENVSLKVTRYAKEYIRVCFYKNLSQVFSFSFFLLKTNS